MICLVEVPRGCRFAGGGTPPAYAAAPSGYIIGSFCAMVALMRMVQIPLYPFYRWSILSRNLSNKRVASETFSTCACGFFHAATTGPTWFPQSSHGWRGFPKKSRITQHKIHYRTRQGESKSSAPPSTVLLPGVPERKKSTKSLPRRWRTSLKAHLPKCVPNGRILCQSG